MIPMKRKPMKRKPMRNNFELTSNSLPASTGGYAATRVIASAPRPSTLDMEREVIDG